MCLHELVYDLYLLESALGGAERGPQAREEGRPTGEGEVGT